MWQRKAACRYDAVALDEAEKRFWRGLWDTAVEDAVVDLGIDMVRFGPVAAAVVVEEPAEPALNFVLGAAAPRAVEDGYLPAAVKWMERHDVDYRVPLAPGLPEFAAAEEWLQRHRYRLVDGPAKLLRDGSPPQLRRRRRGSTSTSASTPGKTKASAIPWRRASGLPTGRRPSSSTCRERTDGAATARSTATSPWPTWRCTIHEGVAVLALASRLVGERDGLGQRAVLHRCIADAAAAGCTTMAVAEAGCEPAVADRESLVRAGFEDARSHLHLAASRQGADVISAPSQPDSDVYTERLDRCECICYYVLLLTTKRQRRGGNPVRGDSPCDGKGVTKS